MNFEEFVRLAVEARGDLREFLAEVERDTGVRASDRFVDELFEMKMRPLLERVAFGGEVH